jgi:hypothetical protein
VAHKAEIECNEFNQEWLDILQENPRDASFMYVPVGISATTFNTGLETATKRIPNNGFVTPKQVKKGHTPHSLRCES